MGIPPEVAAFFGNAGDPVPQVDADDVKTIWTLGAEASKRHPSKPGEVVALA